MRPDFYAASALFLALQLGALPALAFGPLAGPIDPNITAKERIMSATTHALDGAWRVIEIDGEPLPEGAIITFEIEGNQIKGQSTCNAFATTVEIDGEKVVFGALPRMREVCGPELTRIEDAFKRAVIRTDSYNSEPSGEVSFQNGPVLLFRAEPAQ